MNNSESSVSDVNYDWLWKAIAAVLVPVAVAATPAIFAWVSNDRGVDNVIVKSAFDILEKDPQVFGESKTREWAVKVIERYSGVEFSDDARTELESGPLPISQTASNPNSWAPEEIEKWQIDARNVNNDKLLNLAIPELGVTETKGSASTPAIIKYNESIGSGRVLDDETPWNSQFMNWVVGQAGYAGTQSARSRSWENWGKPVQDETGEDLIAGCVAVLWRLKPDSWAGIVGIYLGDDSQGRMRVLAGNLFNKVDVGTFDKKRLITCRLSEDWEGPAQ